MTDNAHWLELQRALGPRGRLGIAARVFSPAGELRDEITFNADDGFPMASTAKVAIGMLAAACVARSELSLKEQIRIDPKLLVPGMARSPLDHLFYNPFSTGRTENVDELLGFMIRYSDNTASDALLRRLGGVQAVVRSVEDWGIRRFHLKRTFSELVAFYYGLRLPPDRRPHIGQIAASIWRLRRPYICREAREKAWIDSGDDCCTPRAMADLLGILATERVYGPAYSHMRYCAGGRGRIRKGLSDCRGLVEQFAHKTGTVGGIANDVGIVKFIDGSFATLCIMTCLSSEPLEVRDAQIAAATREIANLFPSS